MIITCPCGEKNFEVDSKLIPDEGRLLKCGTCDKTWFFNKNENNRLSDIKPITTNISSENKPKQLKKNKQILKENISNTSNDERSALIKYKPESTFTVGKLLSYLIVLIITFVAVIIILDTFKNPLSLLFPNLELMLYNLFETLKDLILFTKDLK